MVTLSGRTMLVMERSKRKAPFPMVFRWLGKETLAKKGQVRKASTPISVTLSGRAMEVINCGFHPTGKPVGFTPQFITSLRNYYSSPERGHFSKEARKER